LLGITTDFQFDYFCNCTLLILVIMPTLAGIRRVSNSLIKTDEKEYDDGDESED